MKKVFVNGTFDLLHEGHIALLEYAKTLGETLAVAIDSDERVKQLKGPDRPIQDQKERTNALIALKAVNDVYIFDTDDELEWLVSVHDVMVKGSDYKGKPIIGESVCKELVFFDRIDGYSTTQKIQDIADRG